jgi:hypothetical protein
VSDKARLLILALGLADEADELLLIVEACEIKVAGNPFKIMAAGFNLLGLFPRRGLSADNGMLHGFGHDL